MCAIVPVLAALGFLLVSARVVERADAGLSAAELEFLLSGITRTVELNLQLGLPLAELQQVDTILESAVASAPDVLAADVISLTGVTLFSTDRGAVGEPVPPAWADAAATSRGMWRASERETVTFGEPLSNDFGQREGWVAIIVDAERLAPPLSRMGTLISGAALVLVAVAAAGLGLGLVIYSRTNRWIAATGASVRARAPIEPPRGALGIAANAAISGMGDTEARVERVQRDLRRLDAEL
ncbi:hypothetical protein ATO13_14650 [Stappia sp. 22II-S9-Z10]|nr:hypothetical protein ATO13_14650 [Stappia sp. 22II-S9-Z10]